MSAHLLQAPSVHVTDSSLHGNRSAQGDEAVKLQQAQMQFGLQHHTFKKKVFFFKMHYDFSKFFQTFVEIILFHF